MPPDPKLVEAVARALCLNDTGYQIDDYLEVERATYVEAAEAALAAISASGDWWIAPWNATLRMKVVAGTEAEAGYGMGGVWGFLRDAHLKDPGTAK